MPRNRLLIEDRQAIQWMVTILLVVAMSVYLGVMFARGF